VMTGCDDGTVWLWNAQTGENLGELLQNQRGAKEVAFSPEGRVALACYGDGSARFLDLATGRPVGAPLEHYGRSSLVTFSPDGRRVATRDRDSKVVRVQPVPAPWEGEAQRLVLWTQVVTGLGLDVNGYIEVLDAEAWHQRQARLEALGGPPRLSGTAGKMVTQNVIHRGDTERNERVTR
jgi:hypothetical protein